MTFRTIYPLNLRRTCEKADILQWSPHERNACRDLPWVLDLPLVRFSCSNMKYAEFSHRLRTGSRTIKTRQNHEPSAKPLVPTFLSTRDFGVVHVSAQSCSCQVQEG